MCGIAGIMVEQGRRLDPSALDRLTSALKHRGPDDTGRYENGSVGLVNVRLSIIDLATGHQPFENADGTVLVANGEIYNDLDLRQKLKDAPYKTHSDCESALHLYHHKGTSYADDLRGMYGIALYDPAKASLVLSRDPFGIKQLYYVATPDIFAFASEAQALIAAGLARRGVDSQKRAELFQLKFTTGSETIYPGIYRVLPGETLIVKNGRIVERRRAPSCLRPSNLTPRPLSYPIKYPNPLRELGDVLKDSVHAHVRSDVPYGLFLSGGIDSATLLAVMARSSSASVTAFTAAFPDSRARDETQAAQRVAKAAGADHHLVPVTHEDFWNLSPRVAAAVDDPTTDAAALPTYKLASAARAAGIKVVLSGEGADEVFGGYSRYRRATWLWGLLARKTRAHGVFRQDGLDVLKGWRDGLARAEKSEEKAGLSAMQRLQAIDCAEWLPNDLLVKLDRCLMAHGVEGRTPFLDPMVAPFAFGLPDRLKVKGKFGKWLLRKWLQAALPEAESFARKNGFNPPIGEWMEAYKTKLKDLILAQPGIAEMSIAGLVHDSFEQPANNAQAAWSLLFYALWHSHHILDVPADGSIGDVLSAAAKRG